MTEYEASRTQASGLLNMSHGPITEAPVPLEYEGHIVSQPRKELAVDNAKYVMPSPPLLHARRVQRCCRTVPFYYAGNPSNGRCGAVC